VVVVFPERQLIRVVHFPSATAAIMSGAASMKQKQGEVMFVMDLTGSMDAWLDQAKTRIKTICNEVQALIAQYHTAYDGGVELRWSFIGYRDYNRDGSLTKNQLVHVPFTTDPRAIEVRMLVLAAT
jgi:hypothetical protein